MKKIKQFTFVLFIFSALAFSYPVSQGFAQGGGQCDSNPACNPASGTCCGQCDSNPACNPNDPNGIPCCSLEGNNNQHQDPMTHDMDNDDQDNDEINHDRRNNRRHKKNKRGRDRRGELREKLNECLQRERNSHQQQPRSTQHTPAPNCSGSVQQATSANQALDECQANLIAANQQLSSQSSINNSAPNCNVLSNTLASANNKIDEVCASIYSTSEWASNARNEVANQGSSFNGLTTRIILLTQLCQQMGRTYGDFLNGEIAAPTGFQSRN